MDFVGFRRKKKWDPIRQYTNGTFDEILPIIFVADIFGMIAKPPWNSSLCPIFGFRDAFSRAGTFPTQSAFVQLHSLTMNAGGSSQWRGTSLREDRRATASKYWDASCPAQPAWTQRSQHVSLQPGGLLLQQGHSVLLLGAAGQAA